MKYLRTFLLSIETQLQYRANLVMWLVVGAIGPLSMVMAWFAILGDRSQVGGYGRADFVMYYLFFTLGWYVVGGSFCRQLANSIRNGEINKTLLQPYNIVLGAAMREQAWKLMSLVVTLPALLVALYLMRQYVFWKVVPGQEWYLLVTVVLGALIFALIQAIVGVFAFWVTEIWPFAEMIDVLLYLFGGTLAPIALLPGLVQRITIFLPFRYTFYEPVNMLLGNQPDPLGVIWKQGVFVVLLYGVYQLFWKAGLRKYEGVGG